MLLFLLFCNLILNVIILCLCISILKTNDELFDYLFDLKSLYHYRKYKRSKK